METPEEFIQEILANPDDDTPRLIFADWLEERGDPRGEFIRVECEIAALTKPEIRDVAMYGNSGAPYVSPATCVRKTSDLPRYRSLLNRGLQLLIAHGQRWTEFLGTDATGVHFDRGFVTGLTTTAAVFIREAPRWYRLTSIHRLNVTQLGGDLPRFFQCPFLAHIQVLELNWVKLGDEDVLRLANSPNVANLRRLSISSNVEISKEVETAIVKSPHLARLAHVEHYGMMYGRLRTALEARIKANKKRKK